MMDMVFELNMIQVLLLNTFDFHIISRFLKATAAFVFLVFVSFVSNVLYLVTQKKPNVLIFGDIKWYFRNAVDKQRINKWYFGSAVDKQRIHPFFIAGIQSIIMIAHTRRMIMNLLAQLGRLIIISHLRKLITVNQLRDTNVITHLETHLETALRKSTKHILQLYKPNAAYDVVF